MPEQLIKFDGEKFRDAIHYIIERCSGSPDILGKTKLHKCLYYSDMLNFFVTGRPLTGVEYRKAPHGPVARYLDWGLRELEKSGAISINLEDYFGLGKYTYKSLKSLQSNRLSAEETARINEIIDFVCAHSAREISEISHAQPWQGVEMGALISYSTAHLLFPDTLPNNADREWARARLKAAQG